MVEINRPCAWAPTRNRPMANSSSGHDPRMGMSNSTMAANTISTADVNDIARYGRVFPRMYATGPTGAILTCSIVPRSFSRTTERAVETTAVIIEMYAIRPGTRNRALRSCGLYQMRGSTITTGVGSRAPGVERSVCICTAPYSAISVRA